MDKIHAMHLFDDGYEKLRERIFANQKKLGVIPQDALMSPWPSDILKPWDQTTDDEKKLFIRQVEVFAAYAAYTDHEIGRVIQSIEDMGKLDNTLIFYIWGDNGSSSEGLYGTVSEQLAQNGIPTKITQHLAALTDLGGMDVLGGPKTDNMYHAGWAWAGSTPYQGTKLQGAYFGLRDGALGLHAHLLLDR